MKSMLCRLCAVVVHGDRVSVFGDVTYFAAGEQEVGCSRARMLGFQGEAYERRNKAWFKSQAKHHPLMDK